MLDKSTPPPPGWLLMTPAGAMAAFAVREPSADMAALQALTTAPHALTLAEWLAQAPENAARHDRFMEQGWIEISPRRLSGPEVQLDGFLPHVIGGLSGSRRAALASQDGFTLAHTGFTHEEADGLCAAAADFMDFVERQVTRGWTGVCHAVSFHEDVAMLIPAKTFLLFWVDGVAYWLVIGDEPLINNQAFVELIWGLKMAGRRFKVAG